MTRELQDKARDHMSRNEWDPAITLLKQAQAAESDNPYVLGPLAFCYSRLRQHAQAVELYERLCQLEPQVARWPYSLGYQYYDQQQYANAIEYFDKALVIEPSYIAALYRKGYALSTIEGKRGQALTIFENCRKAYQALTDEDARNRERKHYGDACYQQGKLFLEAGNNRLAEERLREAIELKPDEADVHYALGKVCMELKKFDQAIATLKTAQRLSIKPQHYILDYLGRAYTESGQLTEALQVYEQMPPDIRSRSYILRNMADVYMKLEQWDKAEQILREAVSKEQRNHNGHYNLGLVYQQQGKWSRAAQEFKKAIELRQKTYNIHFPEAQQALDDLLGAHPEVATTLTAKPTSPAKPPTSPSGRPVGRVKMFNESRGFGFLEVEDSPDDLFFHISEVEGRNSVQVGEYVEYSLGEKQGKPRAIKLRVLTD